MEQILTIPTDRIHQLVTILIKDPESTIQSATTRGDAFHQVLALGGEIVPALIEKLDVPYSYYVIRALIQIGSASVDPLMAQLASPTALRRANAAYALGKIQAEAAIPALINALKDSEFLVRQKAAAAFSDLIVPAAVLPLCDALQDPQAEVRTAAALALGVQKDERATDPLNALFLKDTHEPVRRAAQQALTQLGHNPAESHIPIAHEIEVQTLKMLSGTVRSTQNIDADSVGIPRVELLVATLESPDFNVQRRAARELIKMGEKAVMPLIAALQSPNADVRAHAAWTLGELGDARAQDALRQRTQDPQAEVQYAAQQALAKLSSKIHEA